MKSAAVLSLVASAAAQSLTEVLAGAEDLSALNGLLETQPDIVSALSNAEDITILAPSNAALESFLSNEAVVEAVAADPGLVAAILSYHVLNGTVYASGFTEAAQFVPTLLTNQTYTNVTGGQVVKAMVEDDSVMIYSAPGAVSTVTTPNVNFTGGTVHIIDSVLQIPMDIAATAEAADLTSLLSAVTTAGLAETLLGLSDVTVFAPTNEAFQKVSNVTASLSNEELANILTYHVIAGTVGYSVALEDGMSIETVQGSDVDVSISDEGVMVNDANVVMADVLVANGVVHVIDMVLIPSADSGDNEDEDEDDNEDGGVQSTSTMMMMAPKATAAMGAAALFGGAIAAFNI